MASHRRCAPPGTARTARATVLSAAAAAALYATAPAGAQPQEGPEQVRAQVDALYQQAERATQSYDAALEKATGLRGRIEALQSEMARTQQSVNRLRDGLGVIAAAEYRDGGLDPSLTLLFTSDPDGYLERAALTERARHHRAGQLHRLRLAERTLRQQRAQAGARLAELDRTRAQLAARKTTVQRKLNQARRLIDALAPAQRAAAGFGAAQNNRVEAAGPLPDLPTLAPVSGRAAEAVAAVRGALGSPYVWGSSGPSAFDCSGLMYWAYQRAGTTLPRTSQEQLTAGRHVPLGQARPGDLVIYRNDASHVAMYVGGGKVIHAPYPGARVRYDPVTMMPVTAVVRP